MEGTARAGPTRRPTAAHGHWPDPALTGSAEADALAELTIGLEAAAAGVLAAVAIGDPDLRPGSRVAIATNGVPGLPERSRTSAPHVLTTVDHLVDDASGFVSVLSSAPPTTLPPGRAEEPPSVTLGSVVDVDDPDHSGRVRVTLSAYADAET